MATKFCKICGDLFDIPQRSLLQIYQQLGNLAVTAFSCHADAGKSLSEQATPPPPQTTAATSVRSSYLAPDTHYSMQFINDH
jgi:hypothetical protein